MRIILITILCGWPLMATSFRLQPLRMTPGAPTTPQPSDPNFEAHIDDMMKKGMSDRSDPDIGADLRKKYRVNELVRKEVEKALKGNNKELAAELEELADELKETAERFSMLAALHNEAVRGTRPSPDLPRALRDAEAAKNDPNFEEHLSQFLKAGSADRASPDLGRQLRQQADARNDPNFEVHLSQFLKAGQSERPDVDLPSMLRMKKYEDSASIKRLAAKAIRPKHPNIAQSLEEIANLIDESTEQYVIMASNMAAMKADSQPYSPRAME